MSWDQVSSPILYADVFTNALQSLAYAEIYLTLATLFRRFTFELYDTDVSDVNLAHDFFLPAPKLDSKGLRVKVGLATA
jgi:hypothetical protein